MLLLCVVVVFRTAKDIKPLNSCEIPPERIESLEEVGQGAFGKVHKAKLIDGLEFFNKNTKDWCEKNFKYKIVAVKELHGEYESVYSLYGSHTQVITLHLYPGSQLR